QIFTPPRGQVADKSRRQIHKRNQSREHEQSQSDRNATLHPLLLSFFAGNFFAGDDFRNLKSVNADFHVGGHLQSRHVIRQRDYLTVNSARGHHFVIFFELLDHFLMVFGFLLLRSNQQKIKNNENQHQRQKT